MRRKKRIFEPLAHKFLTVALAVSLILAVSFVARDGPARDSETGGSAGTDAAATQDAPDLGAGQEDADNKEVPVAAASGITVSFKLDPRATRGMYMGDRWVSPPTYTAVQEGKEVTVEAGAHRVDSRGKHGSVPEWIPENAEMVAVKPSQGSEVKITVRHAGQSSLKVVSQGSSKTLSIKATTKGNTMRVDISQR